jgi:hypothetical protein
MVPTGRPRITDADQLHDSGVGEPTQVAQVMEPMTMQADERYRRPRDWTSGRHGVDPRDPSPSWKAFAESVDMRLEGLLQRH